MKPRITTVTIESETQNYLEQKGMKLKHLVNEAPKWKELIEQQGTTINNMRKEIEEKDKLLFKLMTKNNELQEFKAKVLARMKDEYIAKNQRT